MADLALLAARKHAGRTALKYKQGDEWIDVSFDEFGDAVRETALGLMALGIDKGDRVAILANTRPEWAYACFAILTAGGVSVSIYQTNSPSEVQYVAHHSESKAIFVEDQEQLDKVRSCRAELPALEHIIIFEPSDSSAEDAISLDDLRAKGRDGDAAELEQRTGSAGPGGPALFFYTPRTPGP